MKSKQLYLSNKLVIPTSMPNCALVIHIVVCIIDRIRVISPLALWFVACFVDADAADDDSVLVAGGGCAYDDDGADDDLTGIVLPAG
jgi:hypothetical protein